MGENWEIIDCEFHEFYREAKLGEFTVGTIIGNELPKLADIKVLESRDIYVPNNWEACTRLKIQGL